MSTTTHQLVQDELSRLNTEITKYRTCIDTLAEASAEYPEYLEWLDIEPGKWNTSNKVALDGLTVIIRLLEEKRDYVRTLLGTDRSELIEW